MRAAVLIALAACTTVDRIDDHVDVNPDQDRCEIEAALRGAECAVVYEFARQSRSHLGNVELCVPARYLGAAEIENGPSWPSDDERFTKYTHGLIDPPCFWVCPAVVGCNAFDSCFCLEPAP